MQLRFPPSLPFPSLFFLPLPSYLIPSTPLPLVLEGLGECYKLPQWGLGQSPSRNRFWCLLAFKYLTSGGSIFNDYPDNQLPKFHPLPSQLGDLGSVVILSYEL